MFTVAIAGRFPENPRAMQGVQALIGHLEAYLKKKGQSPLHVLVSPLHAAGGWAEWARRQGLRLTGYVPSGQEEGAGGYDRTVQMSGVLRDTLGEAMLDRADLLLAVWNEETGDLDGAAWELMRSALKSKMPCVWFSARSGKAFWQSATVYDTFDEKNVYRLVDLAADAKGEPDMPSGKELPLLPAAKFIYRKYMNRFGAQSSAVDAKEDLLLLDGHPIDASIPGGEEFRKKLLEKYRAFDRAAIDFNERYQSVLYWRSVLPFITTLFIVVGFYASNVFAAIGWPQKNAWDIIAGCGFLVHGLLNLYAFLLSRSQAVKAYHDGMVRNRQMAEMLRVLIHFAPFGIHLNLRRLCGDNQEMYARLRKILGEAEPETETRVVARRNAEEAFRHTGEMFLDQIAYHERSSKRYSKLVGHLDAWSRTVVYIGFAIVILRACMQFYVSTRGVTLELPLGNGVSARSFLSGFANMMALLVPAWGSFFLSKLTLCNFRFNLDNHNRMLDLLTNERDNFEHISRSVDSMPPEVLCAFGESIAEIMASRDTALWAEKYGGTRVSPL